MVLMASSTPTNGHPPGIVSRRRRNPITRPPPPPLRTRPPVVVLQADNVILAEVIAVLYLNENETAGTSVTYTVSGTLWDINRITLPHLRLVAVEGHHTLPLHHKPVLGAA